MFPNTFSEVLFDVFLLGLGFILFFVLFKEDKRAKERHNTFIQTLNILADSSKEFVSHYIKNSKYK